MVATVELKKSESGMTSYWWVTGLNCSHQLVCLLQMQLNAPSDIETNPEDWCSSMLETHVIAIARLAKSQMAHGQMLPMLDSQFRARLASAHLCISWQAAWALGQWLNFSQVTRRSQLPRCAGELLGPVMKDYWKRNVETPVSEQQKERPISPVTRSTK